jgi:adenylate kinase
MPQSNHDKLREEGIDENQQLLIDAFRASTDQETLPVLLDAHTLIETSNGIVLIPPAVFRALGVAKMVFLLDLPTSILERRRLDLKRGRPAVELTEVGVLQEKALLSAIQISSELDAPLLVCRPSKRDQIGKFLFS